MRKTLELIFFNVALICVLLVGMEVAGQIAFYLWKGYPVFRPRAAAEAARNAWPNRRWPSGG